jgi:hypothetical protein
MKYFGLLLASVVNVDAKDAGTLRLTARIECVEVDQIPEGAVRPKAGLVSHDRNQTRWQSRFVFAQRNLLQLKIPIGRAGA